MALSLYRKYRPEVFSDVVGQEHVEKTLVNAISEGSVAHAYLFCGPRGTGKTTSARLLAKALLCENDVDGQPDGICAQCLEIAQGTHPDVFELDAASRTGVDNVREEIIGRVGFAPTRGRYKVYIIDEVHMLSTQAFNALLKTLEEPPEHVVFVLCTTDPHKVPETIQSRCQRFDFRRFSIEEIVGYLERICKGEGYEYEPEALEFIAAKSAGGMRDATTALEQVGVYTGGKITLEEATRMLGQIDIAALFEIAGFIAQRDASSCFIWIHDLVGKGVDLAQFSRDLASHLRNLYVTAITGGENGIVACTAAQLGRYKEQAQMFGGVDRLSRALDTCGALVSELKSSSDPRLSVEIAMTRLTRPESELTLESLAERIESLEMRPSLAQPVASVAHKEAQAAQVVEETGAPSHDDAEFAEADQIEVPAHQAQQTPAVELEPEPAAIATEVYSGQMTDERLLSAILSVIKREDEAVAGLMSGVSLKSEDGSYSIQFPVGAEFQLRLVQDGKAQALIGRAFQEALGREVDFSCGIGSAQKEAKASQKPQAESAQETQQPSAAPVEDYLAAQDAYAEAASDDGDMPPDFADALSAFGAGIKIEEVNGEE